MSIPTSPSVRRPGGGRLRGLRWWQGLPVLLLVGVVVFGWGSDRTGVHVAPREGRATARAGPPAVLHVEVTRPSPGGIPRVTVQPGSVHAFESVDLYAMVSGYLKRQAVDIGSRVRKGALLAEIGVPRETRTAEEAAALLEQARAQLRQAESSVAAMEAEKQTAAATVAQSRADVERTVARRKFAEGQLSRVSDLHQRQAVPQLVVDEARNERDTAVASEQVARLAVRTAEARLAAAGVKIEQARADVAAARAAVGVASARLDRARVDLEYAGIKAPFDGVITGRGFHPGAFIRSASEGGEVPLLTVVRTDRMRVVVRVPDRDVVLANAGDAAEVTIDALGGETFPGVVSRVAESEDPVTRAMRVEIDLPNPRGVLRTGMYGRATIHLDSPTDRLTVPVSCVTGRTGKSEASIHVVRDGRVRRLQVELGAEDGSSVEIVSGLAADEQVIVRGGAPVDEGTPVVVGGPAPAPARSAAAATSRPSRHPS